MVCVVYFVGAVIACLANMGACQMHIVNAAINWHLELTLLKLSPLFTQFIKIIGLRFPISSPLVQNINVKIHRCEKMLREDSPSCFSLHVSLTHQGCIGKTIESKIKTVIHTFVQDSPCFKYVLGKDSPCPKILLGEDSPITKFLYLKI